MTPALSYHRPQAWPYHAMQMPPWDLPFSKPQSGIKTKSSKNGKAP